MTTTIDIFPPPREAFVLPSEPVFEKTFTGNGTGFSAEREAMAYLVPRGFVVGPMAMPHPRGVMHGIGWRIAKWFWLTPTDKAQLHGILTGNMRTGPVKFHLTHAAPADAIDAANSPVPSQQRRYA